MKTKLNEQQRAHVCKLLKTDKWEAANAVAELFEYEGISAKFFEDMIKEDGLTMDWIEAIATYYREELQLDKHIRKTIMPKIMPATEEQKKQFSKEMENAPAGSIYNPEAEDAAFNAVKNQGARK